ncbi:MAG: amino acid permease [Gammaproteobacteria bacterium]
MHERGERAQDTVVTAATAAAASTTSVAPLRRLSMWHAVAVCIGMVIGAGIFKSSPVAAANLPSSSALLAVWIFAGAMSLAGAMCFAEMAAAFPDQGGDYNFLRQAYGDGMAFLFAWSRFAVIHTGSMALLAFTFGDYLAATFDLGLYGGTWLAAATIVLLAAVNLAGLRFGIGTQVWLMVLVVAGLLAVIAAGASVSATPQLRNAVTSGALNRVDVGTAFVFVFLAYGGWSDTATLSAEMRDTRHGIKRALILGMSIVTTLYVLVNWAFERGLGHVALAASVAPAADLMHVVLGRAGQLAIVGVVAITSITSMNAILIAGARTTYAAARDTAALGQLGRWHVARGTPSAAIVAIAAVSLGLLAFGAYTRGGFSTMVDYLSPVYWLFMTLSGVALFVLRRKFPAAARPFRVPWYPLVPIAFVASSVYVLYSSLVYVRTGAVVGVGVLLVGVLLLFGLRWRAERAQP